MSFRAKRRISITSTCYVFEILRRFTPLNDIFIFHQKISQILKGILNPRV